MKTTLRNRRLFFLSAFLLLGLCLMTPQAQQANDTVQFETVKKALSSAFNQKQTFVITNRKDWKALWKQMYKHVFELLPLPEVDFENKMIIAVFQGFQAPIANIEITNIVKTEAGLKVFVKEKTLGRYLVPPCPPFPPSVITPFHIIQIDRPEKPFRKTIEFVVEQEFYNCP